MMFAIGQVVYVNQQPRCVRLGVRVSASAAVRELRTILTNDTGIPAEDIVLVEITKTGMFICNGISCFIYPFLFYIM